MDNKLKLLSEKYAELNKKKLKATNRIGDLAINGKSAKRGGKSITPEEAENIAAMREELKDVDDQIVVLLHEKYGDFE